MDDDAVALPIVFTSPGASLADTTLAAVAIEKAAEAYEWARRGDATHDTARWVRTVRASVLASPGAEAAMRAEGVPAPAARALAACMPLGADTPAHQWLGIAGAAGVPERERPVLGALGPLALGAANLLLPRDEPDRLMVAPLVNPVPDPADECRFACILATRLDAPGVLERELLDFLWSVTHVLIDVHAGFDDWIPRPGDPTVRVRIPDEHRGLPLAFCPLVATQPAALAALEDGALLEKVLERVSADFNEFLDDQRRTPQ